MIFISGFVGCIPVIYALILSIKASNIKTNQSSAHSRIKRCYNEPHCRSSVVDDGWESYKGRTDLSYEMNNNKISESIPLTYIDKDSGDPNDHVFVSMFRNSKRKRIFPWKRFNHRGKLENISHNLKQSSLDVPNVNVSHGEFGSFRFTANNPHTRLPRNKKPRYKRLHMDIKHSPNGPVENSESIFHGLSVNDTEELDKVAKVDLFSAVMEFVNRVVDTKACSAQVSLNHLNSDRNLNKLFSNQIHEAITLANTLTNIFHRVSSLTDETSMYEAMLKSLMDADSSLSGAGIIFDPDHARIGTQVLYITPFMYRDVRSGTLHLEDVGKRSRGRYAVRGTQGYEWYWEQRKVYNSLLWPYRDVCSQMSRARSGQNRGRGSPDDTLDLQTAVTTEDQGLWSRLSYDCDVGNAWVATYSVPFFGCTPQDSLSFRGVVRVDINLDKIDLNQCSTRPILQTKHRCSASTRCSFNPGRGFIRGSYQCRCPQGFHSMYSNINAAENRSVELDGVILEKRHIEHLLGGVADAGSIEGLREFTCVPCPKGCPNCTDTDNNCGMRTLSNDSGRRNVLIFEMVTLFILMVLVVVVICTRRNLGRKSGFWCLYEVHLLGAFVVHLSVAAKASTLLDSSCMIVIWLREVGFFLCYGPLAIRVYKLFIEYWALSKRRSVSICDRDLVRMFWILFSLLFCFLTSLSAVTLDPLQPSKLWISLGLHVPKLYSTGLNNFKFLHLDCNGLWILIILEIAEFLFSVAVISLSIYLHISIIRTSRTAGTDSAASFLHIPAHSVARGSPHHREVVQVALFLFGEIALSGSYYITLHAVRGKVSCSRIAETDCIRTFMTISLATFFLISYKLIALCKLCCRRKPSLKVGLNASSPAVAGSSGKSAEVSKVDVKQSAMTRLHASAVGLEGAEPIEDIDISRINPDELRYEFTRLYTQLEVYKTKTMRHDNPHISRRRGGRKHTYRRFSLQALTSSGRSKHHSSGSSYSANMGGSRNFRITSLSPDSGGSAMGRPRTSRSSHGTGRSSSAANTETSRSMTPDDSSNSADYSNSQVSPSALVAAEPATIPGPSTGGPVNTRRYTGGSLARNEMGVIKEVNASREQLQGSIAKDSTGQLTSSASVTDKNINDATVSGATGDNSKLPLSKTESSPPTTSGEGMITLEGQLKESASSKDVQHSANSSAQNDNNDTVNNAGKTVTFSVEPALPTTTKNHSGDSSVLKVQYSSDSQSPVTCPHDVTAYVTVHSVLTTSTDEESCTAGSICQQEVKSEKTNSDDLKCANINDSIEACDDVTLIKNCDDVEQCHTTTAEQSEIINPELAESGELTCALKEQDKEDMDTKQDEENIDIKSEIQDDITSDVHSPILSGKQFPTDIPGVLVDELGNIVAIDFQKMTSDVNKISEVGAGTEENKSIEENRLESSSNTVFEGEGLPTVIPADIDLIIASDNELPQLQNTESGNDTDSQICSEFNANLQSENEQITLIDSEVDSKIEQLNIIDLEIDSEIEQVAIIDSEVDSQVEQVAIINSEVANVYSIEGPVSGIDVDQTVDQTSEPNHDKESI